MCRYIVLNFFVLFYLGEFIDARATFHSVKMPSDCSGKTYCDKSNPDYPHELIESLLVGIEDKWQEVGNASIPAHRLGLVNNECQVTPVNDLIYEMVDEAGHMRYVVQKAGRFVQNIRIEECLYPGRLMNQRKTLRNAELTTNVFECQQKYLNLKIVVLSLDGTKLEAVRMKDGVPVCCSCVLIRKNYNVTE